MSTPTITTQILIDMIGAGLGYDDKKTWTYARAQELTGIVCEFAITAGYIVTYSYLMRLVEEQFEHNWTERP